MAASYPITISKQYLHDMSKPSANSGNGTIFRNTTFRKHSVVIQDGLCGASTVSDAFSEVCWRCIFELQSKRLIY